MIDDRHGYLAYPFAESARKQQQLKIKGKAVGPGKRKYPLRRRCAKRLAAALRIGELEAADDAQQSDIRL